MDGFHHQHREVTGQHCQAEPARGVCDYDTNTEKPGLAHETIEGEDEDTDWGILGVDWVDWTDVDPYRKSIAEVRLKDQREITARVHQIVGQVTDAAQRESTFAAAGLVELCPGGRRKR